MAQVRVALDGCQQLVGGVDPDAQFVLFVALEQGQLMLAGPVGVDLGQVLDDLRQRLGQQPVIDQVQHQAHGQCAQHAGNENDHRTDDEVLAIGGRVQSNAQVTVIFAVGAAADQLCGEGAFLAENQVGQPAGRQLQRGAGLLREHGFVGMADRGHAHRVILEQAFDDLHAHFPIQAIDRLGRRVTEHVEDAFGVKGNGLARLVGIEHDLRATEHHANHQCRQQHDPE
ncbi:hypothetical protein D3C84_564240 [compost metagenome]